MPDTTWRYTGHYPAKMLSCEDGWWVGLKGRTYAVRVSARNAKHAKAEAERIYGGEADHAERA